MWGYERLESLGLIAHKGGGSSGGGTSGGGENDWPTYLKDRHKAWLSQNEVDGDRVNMDQAIEEAWDASPYTEGFTHDPTQDIAEAIQKLDVFDQEIDAIDPKGLVREYVEEALSLSEDIIGEQPKQEIIESFRDRNSDELLRQYSRFSLGMADIGAVNSSSFAFGLASLERTFFREISRLNAELSLAEYNQRQAYTLQNAMEMVKLLVFRVEKVKESAGMLTEIRRLNIIAQTEFLSRDLEISAKDASWNLEIWQYASNMLASISGGTSIPGSSTQGDVHQSPSQLQSSMGGALSGAAMGAILAAPTGGLSIPMGAMLGAAGGLGSSFLS